MSRISPALRSLVITASLQTVERLEGLRPEIEDAVTAHLSNCLLESNLELGQCTVVTPFHHYCGISGQLEITNLC